MKSQRGDGKAIPLALFQRLGDGLKVTNKVRFMDCNLELSAQNNPYNDN